MSSSSRQITLVYLDLLFALFAGVNLLNLVLAVTEGRSPHRLERDFLIVRIIWKPGTPFGETGELRNTYARAALTSTSDESEDWTFIQTPTGGGPSTFFIKSPIRSGVWRISPESWERVERVEYRTRGGLGVFEPRTALPLLVIETESSQ